MFEGLLVALVLFWGLWQAVRTPLVLDTTRPATIIEYAPLITDSEPKSKTWVKEIVKPPHITLELPRIGVVRDAIDKYVIRDRTQVHVPKSSNTIPSGTDSLGTALVTIPPEYPVREAMRGTEGWVIVQYTVGANGAVKDAFVVDSQPARVFDQAAITAILRYRYSPMVMDGRAVERVGIRQKIRFELER